MRVSTGVVQLFDLGDERDFVRGQRFHDIRHEVVADGQIVEIDEPTEGQTGRRSDRQSHRATQCADQSAERRADERADRTEIVLLLTLMPPVAASRPRPRHEP
jgi:hypothetical protein